MSPETQAGSEPKFRGKASLSDEAAESLKRAARAAAQHSYSPYSYFPVGAAVLGSSGRIYSGTNVENASYGLSICAERVAVFAAVSAGETRIKAVAVYTPTAEPVAPCGACLSVIAEFADGDDPPVLLLANLQERRFSLSRLLPQRFKPKPKEQS